jgi:hypothetical protein
MPFTSTTDDSGRAYRHFQTSAAWVVEADGEEEVSISGFQSPDGSARRWVSIAGYGRSLTLRQARQLGQSLIAAADTDTAKLLP